MLAPDTGKILAVRGETIPLSALSGRATDDLTPQILMLATGETRVLATAWLTGGDGPDLLLVASSAPHWREFLGDRVHDIALVDRSGNVVASADGEIDADAGPGISRARRADPTASWSTASGARARSPACARERCAAAGL